MKRKTKDIMMWIFIILIIILIILAVKKSIWGDELEDCRNECSKSLNRTLPELFENATTEKIVDILSCRVKCNDKYGGWIYS